MKLPDPSPAFDPAEWLSRATALGFRLHVWAMQEWGRGPFKPAIYTQEPDRRARGKVAPGAEDQLIVDRWGGSDHERVRRERALYDYLEQHPEAGGLTPAEASKIRRQVAGLMATNVALPAA